MHLNYADIVYILSMKYIPKSLPPLCDTPFNLSTDSHCACECIRYTNRFSLQPVVFHMYRKVKWLVIVLN